MVGMLWHTRQCSGGRRGNSGPACWPCLDGVASAGASDCVADEKNQVSARELARMKVVGDDVPRPQSRQTWGEMTQRVRNSRKTLF